MSLFKRLLLSYFPDSLTKDSLNPASMLVSFVSAKDFFNIIDRKIIENYKLNLFDMSVDVFEAKLGLGVHKDMMQSKMTDAYYSYIAAANFNGYKFYNVGNTANALSLLISLYFCDAFDESEGDIFVDSLYAFYLLSFLFESRIKVFPGGSEKEDLSRFIDLYFDFYSVVIFQLRHKITKKHFQEIKKKLLTHIEIFFLMFYYEKRINSLLINSNTDKNISSEFYKWILDGQLPTVQKQFMANVDNIIYSSKIGTIEQDLLLNIAPMDIQLKYLFLGTNPFSVVSNLISNVFDKKIIDKKLSSLVKNKSDLDFIIDYATNPDNFKKGYFKGMKQYVSYMHLQDKGGYEELDEMISEIGDDIDKLNQMQIPASIQRESKIMDQFLNFYMNYVGGLFISRAETFFLRLYKPDLLLESLMYIDVTPNSTEDINLYQRNHLFYIQNQTYYKFVNKKIRQGKEKFLMPVGPIKYEITQTTEFQMQCEDEIAIMTLLQDCNPRIGKIYIKNKTLLDRFQHQYSGEIGEFIQLSGPDFIYHYYEPIFSHLKLGDNLIQMLRNAFTEQDIVRLKNSLYQFDVQFFREMLSVFPWKKFHAIYNGVSIITLLSNMRETLFGFILYYQYLSLVYIANKGEILDLTLLKHVYITKILNIDESLSGIMSNMINLLLEQFGNIISLFIELDDNKEFFSLLKENRLEFIKKIYKKSELEKINSFSDEDVLRMKSVYKHITYYNKRFFIPE